MERRRGARPRPLAVRCDGDEHAGAGHVARCLPLAAALRHHGWEPVFVGRYTGLARWLVERSGMNTRAPEEDGVLGVDGCDAAVVDLYGVAERDLCALAERLPVATPGEACRCPAAGIRIDYHLDRDGERPTARDLPGPAFAPLDPGLPAKRRPPDRDVGTALVATGGSSAARRIAGEAIAALRAVFPSVHVIAGSGIAAGGDVEELPFPGTLGAAIARADVAVSGAGLTAYELACAGVPAVLVGLADNQRRVLAGSQQAGTAVVAAPGEPLAAAIARLGDAAVRARIAHHGMARFDGAGAARSAALLDHLWDGGDPGDVVLRLAVPGDRDRLLAWRNDPSTRANSVSVDPVAAPDHERWLARCLADVDRRLMVAERAAVPVGQVRLDRAGAVAEVSITVAPDARGRGLGAAMLASANHHAALWGVRELLARVRPENERSLRLFRSAGYGGESVGADGLLAVRRTVSG